MRVGVIGTGHVGLITCATLAKVGHHVTGSDTDEEKIALLQGGTPPFYEPGLSELVAEQLSSGRLAFTAEIAEAVTDAAMIFISVGTPPRASGEANLLAVEQSATEVARHAQGRCVVVEKSTVPTGTARRLRMAIQRTRPEDIKRFEVASNPEFLREGKAIDDAMEPERILVGADSEWAFQAMREVYDHWIRQGCRYIETDLATAELAKHASNGFLALKISYINALARLCERANADVTKVAEAMRSDSRIGEYFLDAGLGYGGSCFPKDLQAFSHLARQLGYDFSLLDEITKINNEAVEATLDKILDALWNLEDKRIALIGLSFKPETDDVRFAPALTIAKRLVEQGATVVGYDPQAGRTAKAELPEIEIAPNPYEAAEHAHCLVLCTEWEEFRNLDLKKLREIMEYPVVVDGRNAFDPDEMERLGFSIYPMGRPPRLASEEGRTPH